MSYNNTRVEKVSEDRPQMCIQCTQSDRRISSWCTQILAHYKYSCGEHGFIASHNMHLGERQSRRWLAIFNSQSRYLHSDQKFFQQEHFIFRPFVKTFKSNETTKRSSSTDWQLMCSYICTQTPARISSQVSYVLYCGRVALAADHHIIWSTWLATTPVGLRAKSALCLIYWRGKYAQRTGCQLRLPMLSKTCWIVDNQGWFSIHQHNLHQSTLWSSTTWLQLRWCEAQGRTIHKRVSRITVRCGYHLHSAEKKTSEMQAPILS